MREETQLKILSAVASLLTVLGILQFLAGVWLLDSWRATTGAAVMMFCGAVMFTNLRIYEIERKTERPG